MNIFKGSNSDISEDVQAHLLKVYLTLSLTVLTSILGVLINYIVNIGGIITILISFVLIFCLKFDRHNIDNSNVTRRLGILASFGLFQGFSIGPLINQALTYSNGDFIVFISLLCTLVVFISFTLSAKYARRRSYLYLGGFLGSALNMLALLTLVSIFVPSLSFTVVRIYGGLLLFSGFVIYDTQVIIEQAHEGNRDFISHALSLFLDFLNIFIRVLIIMMRKGQRGRDDRGGGSLLPRFRKNGGDAFDL